MQYVEIRIKGEIDKSWSKHFGNLNVVNTLQEESILIGPVRDQAELRGILTRLADLNMELISVNTKLEEKA